MTTTDNLLVTLIEPGQANKHVTCNEALAAFDAIFADSATVDCAAGGTVTIASPDPALRAIRFALSGSPAGAFSVVHPAAKHLFLVVNGTGQAATVKVSGQPGVAVAAGATELLYCDGTDVAKVTVASSLTSVTMGGDVTGDSAGAVVAALQGIPVSTTDPTTGQGLAYDGSAWAPASQPYDVFAYVPDKPTGSMVCARIAMVRAVALPAGLTGSVATAGTAATASTVISIQKNGVEFGTVTFGIGGATGSFAAASGATFASGDVLGIVAPASADATLADISITLMGTR